MKATDLLQSQHRDIEQLFDQLENTEEGDAKIVREELARNLVAHTVIETEHFYPALRATAPDDIAKAYEEHGLVEIELQKLLTTKGRDPSRKARIQVLRELFEAHTREEEEQLFKMAQRSIGEAALDELGQHMEARFRQVAEQGYGRFLRRSLAENMPKVRGRAPAAAKPARRVTAKKGARKAAAQAPKRAPTRRAGTRAGTRTTQARATQPKRRTSQARKTGGSTRSRTSRGS